MLTQKEPVPRPKFPGGLRASEKVVLGFFAYAVAASVVFPLSPRERLTILALNLLASAVVLSLARFAKAGRSAFLAIVRDWLPCFLILLAYRESGAFFRPDPTHRLDYLFERWDAILLNHPWVVGTLALCSPWLQRYLEFSYLLCYPLVPLGLGSLYIGRTRADLSGHGEEHDLGRANQRPARRNREWVLAPEGLGRRSPIDHFWTAVLLATLVCYAIYPLFPLTPPRVLFHDLPGPAVQHFLRKMNFWILDQYSVQACIFPSGHVAAVTATALALRTYLPRVGVLFLIAAASVAAATVYGRYHYAADALAGALVGLAAFLISNHIHKWCYSLDC